MDHLLEALDGDPQRSVMLHSPAIVWSCDTRAWMWGRTAGLVSKHFSTTACRASGYFMGGSVGQAILPFITANARLPPASPSTVLKRRDTVHDEV